MAVIILDFSKIYRLILDDILERLKEGTISRESAIDDISEVSRVWYYYKYSEEDDNDEFIDFVETYYPQFLDDKGE